jgi:hypothetical protein
MIYNLTTVSNVLRDFTVCLTGMYLTEHFGASTNGAANAVEMFLKWEQLCAYTRMKRGIAPMGFRGVERVKKELAKGTKRVAISAHPSHQILSNQKVYGIWGLYRSPLTACGLIVNVNGTERLGPEAVALVEASCNRMLFTSAGAEKSLRTILLAESTGYDPEHGPLADSIADLLSTKIRSHERHVHRQFILEGGVNSHRETGGRQALLLSLMEKYEKQGGEFKHFGPKSISAFRSWVAKTPDGADLLEPLGDIVALERVLGPTGLLFAHMQTRNGVLVEKVAEDLAREWKTLKRVDVDAFTGAMSRLSGEANVNADMWTTAAHALHDADYATLVRELAAINAKVMQQRVSIGPWVTIEGKKVSVKQRAEVGDLTKVDTLEDVPRYRYFLPTLYTLMHANAGRTS